MQKNITIIGTGAYGTALANVLADKGNNVVMYGVVEQQVDDISINHMNQSFFRDLKLNENIQATMDFVASLEKAEYIVLGVPTKALPSVLKDLSKYLKKEVVIINTAKGIDEQDVDLLSKYIINTLQPTRYLKGYCGLYGPSIASEVASREPTYVNIASNDIELAKEVCDVFTNEYFFAKPSNDLPACEISAALKNVIAIAAGMIDESGLGDNAHASLLTYGLNEIYKIAKVFGAKHDSFTNYATMGDLVLTASSKKSRNYTFGRMIVQENSAKKAREDCDFTVEGVGTCEVANKILDKYHVESKLFKVMYEIIYQNKAPKALLQALFTL
ncbi:NAD(P)H-dependent glycerol-3-phosphate dehydrogenase [Mesoplasma lactucae]|uniref:Glycerol-3-phosphate dehydrogenase [NAD(P)+] n=1 Tax=Mesoplasma lactucae ATCC 49193 TaxID=81460 RepID=A0A291IRA6_9MOLU|nr:NAD(P)H-dependent glycerol-3-phosphate dehydrogenase [Mesoplasma lactucae]ATG97290.1 glycerol-3-phosphate dehydrogenase [Mesoplasma lactucae ATCC 49193]